MFFSKDLLAVKGSPYHRIWLLAHKNEKLKPADLKLNTIKIADSLLEWLRAQDSRRTALPLSADLALGLSRALCHQTLALRRDIQALKDEFRKTEETPEVQIDAAEIERVSILTAPPDFDSFGPVANPDQITLREEPIDLPAPTPDDNEFFGDEGNPGFGLDIFETNDEHMLREPLEETEENEVPIPDNIIHPPGEEQEEDLFGPEVNPTTGLFDQPELPAFEETNAGGGSPTIHPGAPARISGPENGCRDLPPPEFPPVEAMEEDLHMDLPPQPMEIPVGDNQEAPELSLPEAEPEAEPLPKRRKKAKKSKLIVDQEVQLNQDLMRQWREERDTVLSPGYPDPGLLTLNELIKKPLHLRKASLALQNSLKRAYVDERYETDVLQEDVVPEEEVVIAPDMPAFDEIREAEEELDDTQSTLRGASRISNLDLPGTSHTSTRIATRLGSISEAHIPLVNDLPQIEPQPEVEVPDIIDEPQLERSELPSTLEEESTIVESSDPVVPMMPTPSFGMNEFIEKFPFGDSKDFKLVCDESGFQTRREVAVAFSYILDAYADKNPKVHVEQTEYFGPIDIMRK